VMNALSAAADARKRDDEDDDEDCSNQPTGYPVPEGFEGVGPGNKYVRPQGAPSGSPLELNPAYANSISNSQIDWDGVAWDLVGIAFFSVTGGVYSPGLTIPEALIAVGGAGLTAGSELAHTDLCD